MPTRQQLTRCIFIIAFVFPLVLLVACAPAEPAADLLLLEQLQTDAPTPDPLATTVVEEEREDAENAIEEAALTRVAEEATGETEAEEEGSAVEEEVGEPVTEEEDDVDEAPEEEEEDTQPEAGNENGQEDGGTAETAPTLTTPPLTEAEIKDIIENKNKDFSFKVLTNVKFDAVLVKDGDLSNANFTGAELDGVTFDNIILTGANFTDAKGFKVNQLAGAKDKDLSGIIVRGQTIDAPLDFTGYKLVKADFAGAILTDMKFIEVDAREANFYSATLNAADFTGADLSKANFTDAMMQGVKIQGAIAVNANFTRAIIGRCSSQLADRNKNNACEPNVALEGCPNPQISLTPTLGSAQAELSNLSYTNFRDAIFFYAELNCVNFEWSNLTNAWFNDPGFAVTSRAPAAEKNGKAAEMQKVNLHGANLTGACLNYVDLTGSNLYFALMEGTGLKDTKLHKADLTRANVSSYAISQASCDTETVLPFNFDAIAAYTCYRNGEALGEATSTPTPRTGADTNQTTDTADGDV